MITKHIGESRKDSIINHFSLDIEDEESFIKFINEMGYTIDSDDTIIESLYKMWDA